jgi:hypothetical protein
MNESGPKLTPGEILIAHNRRYSNQDIADEATRKAVGWVLNCVETDSSGHTGEEIAKKIRAILFAGGWSG